MATTSFAAKCQATYSQINSNLVPTTYFDDTTVVAGLTYYYVTTAVNSAGQQSTYSNQVIAIIP